MGALSITGIKPGSTSLKLTAGKITKTVPITVLSRNLLALFGDSQLIVDSDTSLTNMGPYLRARTRARPPAGRPTSPNRSRPSPA